MPTGLSGNGLVPTKMRQIEAQNQNSSWSNVAAPREQEAFDVESKDDDQYFKLIIMMMIMLKC